MQIGEYTLENEDKVNRALNGIATGSGVSIGGVIQPDGSFSESALLAEYDRIGGYITKNGDKLKTGSFYDVKAKEPRSVPKIVYLFRVNGQEVEVPEGSEVPGVVKAVKILAGETGDLGGRKKRGKK